MAYLVWWCFVYGVGRFLGLCIVYVWFAFGFCFLGCLGLICLLPVGCLDWLFGLPIGCLCIGCSCTDLLV